jgi:prepilin-type N-terminal cleavage/methylation domain-containing protein
MRRRLERLRREESGYTLVEMVDVMAILGILLVVLALVLSITIRQSSQIQEQSSLQTEVRATVDAMARELRQAYTGDASYPIETATGTTVQFLSPDMAVPYHNRRIAYRLTGGHIDRALTTSTDTDGPPWTGLAWTTFATVPSSSWAKQVGSVRNATVFTYYDKSGALLSGTITPSSVYRVKITVTVSTDASTARQFTYSTSASLRWAPS